jgi:hypothetical protein
MATPDDSQPVRAATRITTAKTMPRTSSLIGYGAGSLTPRRDSAPPFFPMSYTFWRSANTGRQSPVIKGPRIEVVIILIVSLNRFFLLYADLSHLDNKISAFLHHFP